MNRFVGTFRIGILCAAVALTAVLPCHARQPPRRGGLETLLDQPATPNQGSAGHQAPTQKPTGQATPAKKPPAPRPGKPTVRVPRPDEVSLREAVELVEQAYGDELRQNPSTAVNTLLKAVADTGDAARRYALLTVAERVAVEADDADLALNVVGQRIAMFDEDGMRARHGVLVKLKKSVKKFDSALFKLAATIAEEAAASGDFNLADGAADVALDIAVTIDRDEKRALADYRKSRQPQQPPPEPIARPLIADAKQLQKSLQDRRQQAAGFHEAEQRLLANPSDVESARQVGEYLCFVKQDWGRGLKYLARAGNEPVRELAGQELAAVGDSTADPGPRFRLAGGWWRAADGGTLTAPQAAAARAHAAEIYAEIMALLTDPIELALAKKRSGREPDPPASNEPVKPGAEPQAGDRRPR